MAREEGVDYVFAPSVAEMYPEPIMTTVHVSGVSEPLEGESRPTHFAGVATVVAKLFAIAGPCRAYFGEKDFQQLAVIRRMVADLSLPVEVIGCPTVREPDGLAHVESQRQPHRPTRVVPLLCCSGRCKRAATRSCDGERDAARCGA